MCLSATPQSVTGQTPLSSTIPGVAQTHVHWVSETRCIVVAHFSFAFSLPCIRVFFEQAGSLQQVAKVLELQIQHKCFQWIFKIDFLENWLVWSPCGPRDSQESSPVPQFKSINSSALSLLHGPIHIHTWLLEKP